MSSFEKLRHALPRTWYGRGLLGVAFAYLFIAPIVEAFQPDITAPVLMILLMMLYTSAAITGLIVWRIVATNPPSVKFLLHVGLPATMLPIALFIYLCQRYGIWPD